MRKYKSYSKRNKRGRKYNKRSKKGYDSRHLNMKKVFIVFIIFVAFATAGLYEILPDVITFEIGISEQEEDKLRQIVREEIQKDKQQTEEPVVEEQPVEQETKPEETPVTSRGGLVRETTTVDKSLTGYRVTSYYPGDGCLSTNKTGTGKTTTNFSTMTIAGKQVYTYQGKIVVAAATNELKRTGYSMKGAQESQVKHYFNYYDTGTIIIDGNSYEYIVLDSCGAAMWKGEYRIDIFVPNSSNVINRSNVTAYFN